MKIFTSSNISDLLTKYYIFLDNDFLGELLDDEDVLTEIVTLLSTGYLLLDPLTELEFRRDIYIPEQRILREEFISKSIFLPVANHQDIFIKLQENALLLSKIYAHENQNNKISLVDLFLGARLMYQSTNTVLITSNKKDFPKCIFNVLSIINIEKDDGVYKAFYVVSFNRSKFDIAYERLQKVEERFARREKST